MDIILLEWRVGAARLLAVWVEIMPARARMTPGRATIAQCDIKMNFEAEIEVVFFCFCFVLFCFFASGHDPCPRRWRHAFWETLLKSAELSRVCVPRVYRDLLIMVTVGHLMTRRRRSTSQESRWRQRVRFLPKSKMINLGGHKRLMGTRNLHLLLLKKTHTTIWIHSWSCL